MPKNDSKPAFDYTSIMNESVDAWPEPDVLPAGHWQFQIKGAKSDASKGRASFVLQGISPLDDVDQTAVSKFNGNFEDAPVFLSFDLSRHQGVARLKQLIKALGLGEYSLNDALKAVKGMPVAGEVTHTPRNDGSDGVYVNVRGVAPITA